MSRMPRPRRRVWPRALDLGATHPLLGAILGLALVAILVPILYVFRGEDPRQTIYPSIPLFFLVPVLLASAIGGQRAGVLVSTTCCARCGASMSTSSPSGTRRAVRTGMRRRDRVTVVRPRPRLPPCQAAHDHNGRALAQPTVAM
jgi:hypothetical protein